MGHRLQDMAYRFGGGIRVAIARCWYGRQVGCQVAGS
jgi:hypothetical protein